MTLRWMLTVGAFLAGCDKLFGLEHIDYDAPPPCEPASVATGRNHTCAVDYKGRVLCWGRNGSSGAALPGSNSRIVLTPQQVVLPRPATEVEVGREFSCALLDDGAVWCWGDNGTNALGAGADYDDDGPVQVVGLPPVVELATGAYHACAIAADDRSVWCWGRNGNLETGQTGPGLDCNPDRDDEDPCVAPQPIPNTAGSKRIALGHRYSCLIDANDRVACWGRNSNEMLGSPSAGDIETPTLVAQLGTATAIGASGRTTCAVETGGDVKCWGEGADGQFGNGTFSRGASPPVGSLVENARDVAVGGFGGCALLTDKTVSCWGDHDGGHGTHTTSGSPRPASISGARKLATHFFHSCAVVGSDVQCWGANFDGQLGRGTRSIASEPVVVPVPSAVRYVAMGTAHACAVTDDGVLCWGENDHAQAGSTDLARYYVPTPVAVPEQRFGIAAAFQQTCVWGAGTAQCWGQAYEGRLGTGISQRSHGVMPVTASGIDSLAVGGNHMCALLQNNTIRCFGFNGSGQLGADPVQTRSSLTGVTVPDPGGNLMSIHRVITGHSHSCALSTTGLWCWGENGDGQLGLSSTTDRSTPAVVPVTGPAEAIAGERFTCARNMAGEVYCWGRNSHGQLGIGSRESKASPQKVDLPGTATALFGGASANRVCVRLSNGDVYCWGEGDNGELGNGKEIDSTSPVIVPAFATATTIAIGDAGTCAVVGEELRCTGEWAVLGNGDASLSVPTSVDLALGACEQ